MKDVSKTTKIWFGGSIPFLVFLFVGMSMPPVVRADEWAKSVSLPPTLIRKSESDKNIEAVSEAIQASDISQGLPAKVSIFYPTMGQSEFGASYARKLWMRG